MGQLKIDGTIIAGPAVVTDSVFPSGTKEVPFSSSPNPKPMLVDTGLGVRNVNSSSAYTTLSGVGADDDVAQGDTLYIRVQNSMLLRLTFAQSSGPDLVSVLPINGTYVMEFPSDQYLKLLEVKGVGTVEYFVCGQK